MAKLTRESKLRERRIEKAARKDARKREAAAGAAAPSDALTDDDQLVAPVAASPRDVV